MKQASYAFSAEDYKESKKEYERDWQTLDQVLYSLCREHPHHKDKGAVNAKVNIIARSFATGIERQVPSKGGQGSSISTVSDFFLEHNKCIDRRLIHLSKISEPLTPPGIRRILLVHGLLVQQLKDITKGSTPRSFASKYVHFHNPAVLIYDSVAAGFLPRLLPLPNGPDFEIRRVQFEDQDYADYVRGFAKLYQCVSSQSLPVTSRSLDYYLCREAHRHS